MKSDVQDGWMESDVQDGWMESDVQDGWMEPDVQDGWMESDVQDGWMESDVQDRWRKSDVEDGWMQSDVQDGWVELDVQLGKLNPMFRLVKRNQMFSGRTKSIIRIDEKVRLPKSPQHPASVNFLTTPPLLFSGESERTDWKYYPYFVFVRNKQERPRRRNMHTWRECSGLVQGPLAAMLTRHRERPIICLQWLDSLINTYYTALMKSPYARPKDIVCWSYPELMTVLYTCLLCDGCE